MHNKTLVLDGISGVPLALELTEAMRQIGMHATYLDMKKLARKPFYGIKSIAHKLVNRAKTANYFYAFPMLHEQAFERYIRDTRPSTILVVGFAYKFFNPQFLQKLKLNYGIKIYLYDTDSCNLYAKRREFIFFIETELPVYDEIFSFSKVTTRFFKETRQLNASFLPFGAKKVDINSVKNDQYNVLFVGSCDLRRVFLLENIKDKVTVFGARWSRNYPLISEGLQQKIIDRSIWGDALLQVLTQSKIVLNITRSHFYGAETGVNLRIFEALAAGCFLLTDYCEELAELFNIGEEIEVYHSSQDLIQKVEFYLANPEARLRIAKNGHAKFLTMHTWEEKAKVLASKMMPGLN